MPMTPADLAEIFRYRAPTPEQIERYTAIRDAAHTFAFTVLSHTPASPDQTVAIRKIREAVMVANAAIALGGRY